MGDQPAPVARFSPQGRIGHLKSDLKEITLYPGCITRGRESYSLDGVKASVTTSGLQIFLEISGPDFAWVPRVAPRARLGRSRKFAAAVNQAAASHA